MVAFKQTIHTKDLSRRLPPSPALSFAQINDAARVVLPSLLLRWLPNGRLDGREWVALNPRRADSHVGSFKVNLTTGKWSDFATGDKGADIISLAAFLFNIRQAEAAKNLSQMLGLSQGER